jgi:hypothetical protein
VRGEPTHPPRTERELPGPDGSIGSSRSSEGESVTAQDGIVAPRASKSAERVALETSSGAGAARKLLAGRGQWAHAPPREAAWPLIIRRIWPAARHRDAYKEIGGHKLYVRTYEETVPGPTLRCRSVHCHMMNHEELGMMQTVEVYKDL